MALLATWLHLPFFCGVLVAHLFSFLFCVFSFVCLYPVSCMPIFSGFSVLANSIRCYNRHLFCCLHCSIQTGIMCAFQVTACPMIWGQSNKNVPSSPFLCRCVEELPKLHKLWRPVDINSFNHIDAPQILEVNLNWFGDYNLPRSICRYGTNVPHP